MTTGNKFIGVKADSGSTIRAHRFVKASGTCAVVECTSDTDVSLGVSLTDAQDGDNLNIAPPGTDAQLILGSGGASIGDLLVSDGNGAGIVFAGPVAGSTIWIDAVAMDNGAEGDIISVAVRSAPIYLPATTTTTTTTTTTEAPTTTTTTLA